MRGTESKQFTAPLRRPHDGPVRGQRSRLKKGGRFSRSPPVRSSLPVRLAHPLGTPILLPPPTGWLPYPTFPLRCLHPTDWMASHRPPIGQELAPPKPLGTVGVGAPRDRSGDVRRTGKEVAGWQKLQRKLCATW